MLHDKDLCIGCGYCFYACPFGAPQFPQAGAFGLRGKMDKCTFCAGGPEARTAPRTSSRSTAATAWPRASCRPAPRCARPRRCSAATATCWPTSTASASLKRGKGAEVWGWATAYGKPEQKPQQPAAPRTGGQS
ncbi:MAG: 4Fe-4S binding protein [Comamonadaceae bacterium]|nr:4Fe-4S binding protein [Comamonadaceae bacterium]